MSRGPGAAQRAILAALESGPATPHELASRLDLRLDNVKRALTSLSTRGHVAVTEGRASLTTLETPAVTEVPSLIYDRHDGAIDARLYHGTWRALLSVVDRVDTLIADCPYSARTHSGFDAGAESVGGNRKTLPYAAWSEGDVRAFVGAWSPRVNGWFVSITDWQLAPVWERALRDAGRYVFTPLAYVAPGMGTRFNGDGPSSWTLWIVVARPRSREFAKWGTLPGAYVRQPGWGKPRVTGGKPLGLMRALVEDYSRPGTVVCDPCMGAGSTLRAAIELGRGAVGADMNEAHARLASSWLAEPVQQALLAS